MTNHTDQPDLAELYAAGKAAQDEWRPDGTYERTEQAVGEIQRSMADVPCARCTALQAQVDALRAGLADATDRLVEWVDAGPGVSCDHAAGICNCAIRDIVEDCRALLSDPPPANPLAERVKQLEGLLRRAVSATDDPETGECRLDHHGTCQEHCGSAPCWWAEARALLTTQEATDAAE